MGKFKDKFNQYRNVKRFKDITVGYYDEEFETIHEYSHLPGWPVYMDIKDEKINGFYFGHYVTGKDGELRHVGITLSRDLIIGMLDMIDEREEKRIERGY